MGYEELRRQEDPEGHLNGVSDSEFLETVARSNNYGKAAGTHDAQIKGNPGQDTGGRAIPAALPATMGSVFMAVPRAAKSMVQGAAESLVDIPRGLVVNPLKQTFQNRPATPEEEKQSLSGLAGLTTTLTAGPVGKLAAGAAGKTLVGRLLANSGAGFVLGSEDAAIRSQGDPKATRAGGIGGAVVGPLAGELVHAAAGPKGAVARGAAPFASVEERLKQAGPEGADIAKRVVTADDLAEVRGGTAKVKIGKSGFKKMSQDEDDELHDVLRGFVPLEQASERVRTIAPLVREYLDTVVPRAQQAGIKVGQVANYFMQHIAGDDQLARGKVRDAVVRNLVRMKRAATPEEAAAAIDDYLAAQKGDQSRGDLAARIIAGENNLTMPEALSRMRKGFTAPRSQKMGNLDFSREYNNPFYDPSPSRQLPRYIENAEHRIAEAEQFGPQGELIKALTDAVADPQKRASVDRLGRVAIGALEPQDSDLATWLRRGRSLSATKLGPLSAVRNLTQTPTNTAMRADLPSLLRGAGKSLTKTGGEIAEGSGATSEHSLHNVAHQVGGDNSFVSKWLKATGFSQSEAMNRRIAANVGYEYAKNMAKRLAKNPKDSLALSELESLGIDPKRAGALTHDDLLLGAKRFNDQTQFRSRPIDLPAAMTDNPVTANTTQFTAFPFQQGRLLARETLDRLRSGDIAQQRRALRNVALIATVFPATGKGYKVLNDWVTGRTSDTKGVEAYLEAMAQTGGTMSGANILEATKYGEGDQGGSVARAMIGPTGSTIAGGVQVLADVGKNDKLSDANKRWLLRQGLGGYGNILAPRLFPPKEKKRQAR